MKIRLIAMFLSNCTLAVAESPKRVEPAPPAQKPAIAKETPSVEASIPDSVKALGEPAIRDFPNGIQMAITAASESAQTHVNQGLNQLHGGWEFEACRHFAAAMREDPECLLAHWGMVMSLLSPSPETAAARNAATHRLLDLVDAGKGSELERGYAYGLIQYLEKGPTGAASAFRKIAANFPNEPQAGIFAALFSRGGYDEFGNATPDQQTAETSLLALIDNNPQSPIPLNALLTIRADGPDLSSSLELALKLVHMSPDYGPYLHLLGHYQWRCGQHSAAIASFGRATTYFENWMKANKATVADCPEWVKSECYRTVALVSKGDFDSAAATAKQLAATPFPKNRSASPGARLLMWDAKTLPARLLLHRGLPGNAAEALKTLPRPEDLKQTPTQSLAYWWIDGLRLALEAQRLIDAGKLAEAHDVVAALTHHGEVLTKTQAAATASGERSAWNRSFHALEVLASDLHGRLAMAGPKETIGTAYNWFASASDRQHPAPMMFPPLILTPMAVRLGEFYLTTKRPLDAVESYQQALTRFPNDLNTLLGLANAYQQAALPQQVTETQAKIQALKTP